ncbi:MULTISPECIES: two-component regulator propeller domain-containing protein [Flavobacteriaceae]|uniref:two-component regulator propeller domain-containing protein n=1 Tax=Flavobacteriaceae TaxID=49546 RepID=UPI001490CB72|nr:MULTISPECIES: two-component regulator propeller domain-containing protein [Allomuricauda]MDC6367694.1 two-component regulator propeller domain-containing protein [Muricauda sp. AC10]
MKNTYWKVALGLLILTFAFHKLHGQWENDTYTFIPIEKNTPKRAITSIVQDNNGLIWIATVGFGLNKYDGVTFTSYTKDTNDDNSINSSLVHSLYIDKSERLWVGTAIGLDLYDRFQDSFTHIQLDTETDIDHPIFSIAENGKGQLLVGTQNKGMFSVDLETLESKKVKIQKPYLASQLVINSIINHDDDKIFVGTNAGLFTFNRDNNLLIPAKFATKNGMEQIDDSIETLFLDRQKNLWAGTFTNGAIKIKTENDYSISINRYKLTQMRIFSIAQAKDGKILCGTENDGLLVLDENGNLLENYRYEDANPYSIRSNSVWSVFVDSKERIWVGYYDKGLGVHDELHNKFNNIWAIPNVKNSLKYSSVTGILGTKDGRLWISMDGGGIDVYDPKKNQFTHLLDPNNNIATGLTCPSVVSTFEDSKGNIWVGTWNSGIYYLPKGSKTFIKFDTTSAKGTLLSNSILCFDEDSKGNIWIGTFFGGLHKYNRTTKSFEHYSLNGDKLPTIEQYNINKVLVEEDDMVWLGTDKGLFKIENNEGEQEIKAVSFNEQLSESSQNVKSFNILALKKTSDNNIWIGTIDEGAYKFDRKTEKFKPYNKSNGLAQVIVAGILEDNDGNIWFSGNHGLSKLDKESGEFQSFDMNDGLSANNYNRNAAYKDNTGQLFFGSYEGIDFFNPRNIQKNESEPSLMFTDFKLFNRSADIGKNGSPLDKVISETKNITLKHKQSVFTIDFVALNYTRSQNNQYAYYLEGLEDDWNWVGNVRSATYKDLSPGKYVFKVKASNNDGIWNETPITLGITVLPPWWLTNTAIAIYFLMLVIAAFLIKKYLESQRNVKIERQQRRQERLLNEKKIQFFTNISHEFRTPLTLILNPLQDIIDKNEYSLDKKVKEKHQTILKNANRLKTLMDELMDFRKLQMNKMPLHALEINFMEFVEKVASYFNDEATDKNILFSVDSDGTEPMVWGDPRMLEKVIFNLLSNAFKATPENGVITIGVNRSGHGVCFPLINETKASPAIEITIEDTGSGIKKEDLPHIFKRFYRSKNKNTEYYGGSGTGIGLEVAKSFIELHKGIINVKSKEGEGTIFTIILPLGKEHLPSSDQVSSSHPTELASEDAILASEQPYLLNGFTNEPQKTKIMIVEDNHELRNYLKKELKDEYTILEFDNAKKGLKAAQKTIPDLIITDVIMPQMDGFEFCSALKEDINTSHIPIIMLTAKTMDEDRIKGIDSGADVYMTKPFEMRVLKSYLKRLIDNRQIFINKNLNDPNKLSLLENTTEQDKSFIQKVLDYLNENISKNDLSVEFLADDMYLSRSQLYRKIKAMTGLTPNELIKKVRLERAKQMIENGSESIGEVGFKVGFSSPSYFSRCFKSEFGVLPTDLKPKDYL